MMSVNLSTCLYALLCIIILYCADNMVMGLIFIFFVLSYICHLLIFSPLSMCKGGGDEVSVLNPFMHQCQVYVASR